MMPRKSQKLWGHGACVQRMCIVSHADVRRPKYRAKRGARIFESGKKTINVTVVFVRPPD